MRRLRRSGRAVLVVIVMACSATVTAMAASATPSTFTVTTTSDSGQGSLRQAILDANTNAGADTIDFAIPGGGVHVITVASALPAVTDAVSIDARTQPGWSGSPLVEVLIPPKGLGYWDGLDFASGSDDSLVAGIAMPYFRTGVSARSRSVTVTDGWFGIHADGSFAAPIPNTTTTPHNTGVEVGRGSTVERSLFPNIDGDAISGCGDGLRVTDNVIGVDPAGQPSAGNDRGIDVSPLCGSTPVGDAELTIIGSTGHGNVVGGSDDAAIALGDGPIDVEGNLIGLAPDGSTANPNFTGIDLVGSSPTTRTIAHNIVGNTVGGGGSRGIAIDVNGTADITNNFLGVDASGNATPNDQGVSFLTGSGSVVGNEIAFNRSEGVSLSEFNSFKSRVTISGNRIHDNGGLGIDLNRDGVTANDTGDTDTGANGRQNSPVIIGVRHSGNTVMVEGSLETKPGIGADIELFQSPSCDQSGYGEGATPRGTVHIDSTSAGPTFWQTTLSAQGTAGGVWTATATTAEGTSEFSKCGATLGSWQSIGGGLVGGPAITATTPQAATVVVHGLDNQLWRSDSADPSSPWSSWTPLGGIVRSSPAVAGNASGALVAVVRGADDALWTRDLRSNASTWTSLGGLTHDSPALVDAGNGALYLFIRGADNALWYTTKPADGKWTAWKTLGGTLTSAPAVTVSGSIYVAARGSDGAVWLRTLPFGGTWTPWTSLGGGLRGSPALATVPDGSVHLFLRGLDDQLWQRVGDSTGWTSYASFGGILLDSPAATNDRGPNSQNWHVTIGIRGSDGAVWINHFGTPTPTG